MQHEEFFQNVFDRECRIYETRLEEYANVKTEYDNLKQEKKKLEMQMTIQHNIKMLKEFANLDGFRELEIPADSQDLQKLFNYNPNGVEEKLRDLLYWDCQYKEVQEGLKTGIKTTYESINKILECAYDGDLRLSIPLCNSTICYRIFTIYFSKQDSQRFERTCSLIAEIVETEACTVELQFLAACMSKNQQYFKETTVSYVEIKDGII